MNDLLVAVDGLPHHERIAHAAAIGKAFRGDERPVALIEQLLAHEALDLPDYEADDGIRALFQDQATNVASNHLRDQLAMFMAVAAQEQAVLKRVHGTNSKWFKVRLHGCRAGGGKALRLRLLLRLRLRCSRGRLRWCRPRLPVFHGCG